MTLDIGFVIFKILFVIFMPRITTLGIEVIIKLDIVRGYTEREQSKCRQ